MMNIDYKTFSKQIKDKYPVYEDIDDFKLAKSVIERYPVYKDKVEFPPINPIMQSYQPEVTPQIQTMESDITAQPGPTQEFLEAKKYEPASVLSPVLPSQTDELRTPTGGREIPIKDTQAGALVGEAVHAATFGQPDVLTEQRIKEFPVPTIAAQIAGTVIPMGAEGAGIIKVFSRIPAMIELAKMGKAGKTAKTAIERSAIAITDSALRNKDQLTSTDTNVREEAAKNLGINVAAMAASAIPEAILPKGMVQPLAQMVTNALVTTGGESAAGRNAWDKENIASTIANVLASGIFSIKDINKKQISQPEKGVSYAEKGKETGQEAEAVLNGEKTSNLGGETAKSESPPTEVPPEAPKPKKPLEPFQNTAETPKETNVPRRLMGPRILKLLSAPKKEIELPKKETEVTKKETEKPLPDDFEPWNETLDEYHARHKESAKETEFPPEGDYSDWVTSKYFEDEGAGDFEFDRKKFLSGFLSKITKGEYDVEAQKQRKPVRLAEYEYVRGLRNTYKNGRLITLSKDTRDWFDNIAEKLQKTEGEERDFLEKVFPNGIPENADDVMSALRDPDVMIAKDFEKWAKDYNKQKAPEEGWEGQTSFFGTEEPKFTEETGDLFAGTEHADTRSAGQKTFDELQQEKVAKQKTKQREDVFEGTPMSKGEQEAKATKQTDLFEEGANVGEFTNLSNLRKEAKTKSGILRPSETEKQYQEKWRIPSEMRVEMPEQVELFKGLTKGEYPKILNKLNESSGRALGYAEGKKVRLRGDIFIGPLKAAVISKGRRRDIEIAMVKDDLIKSGVNEKDIIIKEDQGAAKIYVRDPNFAEQVFSHEIGHVISEIQDIGGEKPNKTLGAMLSGVSKSVKDFLASFPGAKGQPLTPGEKIRLEDIARKKTRKYYDELVDKEIEKETDFTPQEILDIWNNVDQNNIDPKLDDFIKRLSTTDKKSIIIEAMKGRVSSKVPNKIVKEMIKVKKSEEGTSNQIAKKYREEILKEIEKRQLIDLGIVKGELKRFSRIWKPFNPEENPRYTKYRHKPSELYADAVSGMLVHPELIAREAPTFYKGFLNYMENRPELREVWERIQERNKNPESVLEHRHEQTRENYKKAEEIRKKGWEDRFKKPSLTVFDNIKQYFWEKGQPLFKKVSKVEKKLGIKIAAEDDPRVWFSEWQYVPAQVRGMLIDVDNVVKTPLTKAGLTVDDLGEYMDYRRTTTELREKAASEGMQPQYAEKQLAYMKKQLGDDKFAVLEKAADYFWKIRNEHVIPILTDSKMFRQQLIDKIKSNQFYAKNTITKFMEDQYGKAVTESLMPSTQLIKSIKGTLEAKANPFVETVLQDAMLLRAVHRNSTHKSIVNFLKEYVPDEVNSPMHESKEVHYVENGELKTNTIDLQIAKLLETNAKDVNRAVEWGHKYLANPLKQILTQKNPWFIFRNAIRDTISLAQNIPEANLRSAITHVLGSYKEAYKHVRKNEMNQTIRDMYKNKALISGRSWSSNDILNESNEFDRMLQNFELNEPAQNRLIAKGTHGFLKFIEDLAQTTEKATKIGGWKLLKEKAPEMSDKERAAIVRSQVGSPDFYRGGTGRLIYNNVFLFSNANLQGWRGAYEGFQRNKSRFVMKMMLYNVVPKVAMFGAKIGALAFLGNELNKKIQESYNKIPEYQLSRYGAVVPVSETESGKVWFIKIPTDFTGQAIGSFIWHLLNASKDVIKGEDLQKDLSLLWDEIQNQSPFSSLHPVGKVAQAWSTYAGGHNPEDKFYYKKVVPEKIYGAGLKYEIPTMLKWTGEQFGSSIWWKIPDNYDLRKKGKFEKALGIPVAGPSINAFFGLSDAGTNAPSEKLKETIKEEKISSIEKTKAMEDHFNKIGHYNRGAVKNLYRQLRNAGEDVGKFSDFNTSYKSMVTNRSSDPALARISRAPTVKQREVLVDEYLDSQNVPNEFRRTMKRRLMNKKYLLKVVTNQQIQQGAANESNAQR